MVVDAAAAAEDAATLLVLSFDGESIEQYFLMIILREFSVTWAICWFAKKKRR